MIKKLIYVLLSLVILVVVAVVSLVVFIDPNDYKTLITQEVKKATGRELSIDGNIAWQFWPNVGISIEKAALSNPEGFAEKNLVQFDKAEAAIAVWPLLSNTAQIKLVRLHGARFFMQTTQSGANNLDGLVATSSEENPSSTEPATTPAPTEPAQESTAWNIAVGEIDIQNASALILNDKTNSSSEISELNLIIGQFAVDTWVPMSFVVKGQQNSLNFSFEGKTEAKLANEVKLSQLKDLSLKATVKDQTQNLDVESLVLSAEKLGLAIASALSLEVKGKAADLSFDSNSKLTLNVDKNIEQISITGMDFAANLAGKSLPKEAMKVTFNGDVNFDNTKQYLDAKKLALALDEIKFTGTANVALGDIPKVRFDFASEEINLDTFLGLAKSDSTDEKAPSEKEETASKPAPENKAPLSDVEPDLSALNTLDIAGKIAINRFIASNVKVSDVVTELAVIKGKAELKRFDAALYDGSIAATALLDATQTPATYSVSKSIKGVQIQPLLMDAASQKMLQGKGNIEVALKGAGLSPLRMRTGSSGSVAIALADGAVNGVNIPQMLREAKAALKGEKVPERTQELQTKFTAFTAVFDLAKGVASTKNMEIAASGISIKNQGSTNLLDESMNFTVSASVVETKKGQETEDMGDLKGITVPIKVAGSWSEPSFGLDLKGLLSSNKIIEKKVTKELERGLDKVFGDNEDAKKAVGDMLNKLF